MAEMFLPLLQMGGLDPPRDLLLPAEFFALGTVTLLSASLFLKAMALTLHSALAVGVALDSLLRGG